MQFARFLAPALVLLIAVVARAGDAKTYNLDIKPVIKVGELTATTTHDESTTDVNVTAADGSPLGAHHEKAVTESTATDKVIEVDAEGRVTKRLVHFSAWKHTKGDIEASELTGAHIEVSNHDATRGWKILTPGITVTPTSKAWLDKKFGPKEMDGKFFDALIPSKPVAIGESWDGEVAKLAEAVGKGMKFDVAKSSVKATLVGVEDDVATIHLELKLQASVIPTGPNTTVKVLEGGVFEIVADGRVPLSASARGDGSSITSKLSVKTEGDKESTITIVVEGRNEVSMKAGGEMPEVPATK